MLPFPLAQINDGKQDIAIFDSDIPKAKALTMLQSVATGQAANFKEFHYYQGKEVQIELDPSEYAMNVDGDIYYVQGKTTITTIDSGIQFLAPDQMIVDEAFQ